jgi:hypothetical protein
MALGGFATRVKLCRWNIVQSRLIASVFVV